MTSRKEPFLDARLLSRRDSMSIQEKEHVLEALLSEHVRREKRGIFRPFFSLSLKARLAGAFLTALLLTPLIVLWLKGGNPQDELRAKGQDVEAPFFSVSCVGPSEKSICRKGAKLAFRIHPQFRFRSEKEHLYFAAFVKRDADGLIFWFSPATEKGESLLLKGLGEAGVVSKGMLLDEAYEPGKYQIFGILSNAPLERREIRTILDDTSRVNPRVIRISKVRFGLEY